MFQLGIAGFLWVTQKSQYSYHAIVNSDYLLGQGSLMKAASCLVSTQWNFRVFSYGTPSDWFVAFICVLVPGPGAFTGLQ